MKKVLAAISAVSLIFISGAASAQTLSGAGIATGDLNLRQTLGTALACPLNNIPISTASGDGYSTTGASPLNPKILCSFGPGVNVTMTSDWELVPMSYNLIEIRKVTANALAGTCGPATLSAEVVDRGPDLVLYIPFQVIPGSPVGCEVEGYVTISGVSLL